MKKRGLTLIEIMISLSILSIIILLTFNFVASNNRIYGRVSEGIDESVNIRIGLEFLVNEIMGADSVKLIDRLDENSTSIAVISKSSTPTTYLCINDEKIFILDDILRNDTLAQHVVSGIDSFFVENKGGGLYKITINSKSASLSTVIYKRK